MAVLAGENKFGQKALNFSGINHLYDALLSILPVAEFSCSEIAKQACDEINSLGPFERSEFERCDICHMLGHLSERGHLEVRVESNYSTSGRFVGSKLFYKKIG